MNLSGVSCDLTAFHVDPIMGEGRHQHTWTVTAWWPAEPWRDGRAMREALRTVLETIAPDGPDGRELPHELWTGEAIARAVLTLGNIVRVNVDRPAFHAEVWA